MRIAALDPRIVVMHQAPLRADRPPPALGLVTARPRHSSASFPRKTNFSGPPPGGGGGGWGATVRPEKISFRCRRPRGRCCTTHLSGQPLASNQVRRRRAACVTLSVQNTGEGDAAEGRYCASGVAGRATMKSTPTSQPARACCCSRPIRDRAAWLTVLHARSPTGPVQRCIPSRFFSS